MNVFFKFCRKILDSAEKLDESPRIFLIEMIDSTGSIRCDHPTEEMFVKILPNRKWFTELSIDLQSSLY
jgi:hypothetical protein